MPIPPSISITFNLADIDVCVPVIHLSNFASSTSYTIEQWYVDGGFEILRFPFTRDTNEDGAAVVYGYGESVSTQIQIRIQVPSVGISYLSAWTTVAC